MDKDVTSKSGPRRKGRDETQRDVMAILMGDEAPVTEATPNATLSLDISDLIPFANHPFELYEGERLDDMVRSISDYGVIVPIVVRPLGEDELTYPSLRERC